MSDQPVKGTSRSALGGILIGAELLSGQSLDGARVKAGETLRKVAPFADPFLDLLDEMTAKLRRRNRGEPSVAATARPEKAEPAAQVIETTGEEVKP